MIHRNIYFWYGTKISDTDLKIDFSVSSSGSGAGRCDPDLLKADVAMARNRVGRLKRELHQIKHEVANTEAGMQTLAQWVHC